MLAYANILTQRICHRTSNISIWQTAKCFFISDPIGYNRADQSEDALRPSDDLTFNASKQWAEIVDSFF